MVKQNGTVVLVNGIHSASMQSFNSNDFNITTTGLCVVTIIPKYTENNNRWFTLTDSNVTMSNVVLHHTYSYSEWVGDFSRSALIEVQKNSSLVISNVTVVPGDETVTYANAFVLGYGDGSFVNVTCSSFLNFSLTRVSLFYSNAKLKFNFTNVTFRYV
jgi:hypothetical protein